MDDDPVAGRGGRADICSLERLDFQKSSYQQKGSETVSVGGDVSERFAVDDSDCF